MSYILDALKKSEQSRLNVDTPLRQLLLRGGEVSRDSRPVWPYVAGAILSLNAAALYLWWRTPSGAEAERKDRPAQTVVPKQAMPSSERASVQPADGAARRAVTADVAIARNDAAPLPASPPRPLAPSPAVAAAPPVAAAPAAQPATTIGNVPRIAGASGASVTAPAAAAPPVAGESGKDAAGDAQGLELPEALRRELPQLVMSGMVRVMGAPSLVVVNERPFREGEEVAPGLRVEKILERGALFSYKGYRFQRLLAW